MNKIFYLGNGIGAHLTYMNPVAIGSEIYRFIFEIYSDPQKLNFLLKEYEIWVSKTFVEDYMHLDHDEPKDEEMFGFAREYLINRYKLSSNNIPVEGGVYLTNITGEVRGDPRTFSLNTRDNKRLVRTTVMLPPDTLDWLKKYKDEKNVDMGEAIRRAITAYQIKLVEDNKEKLLSKKK